MNKPSIDDLLEQLEDAREAGREIDLEKLCAQWPDLLGPLKERWERLLRFEERFGNSPSDLSDATRRESTSEVQSKIADMADKLVTDGLVPGGGSPADFAKFQADDMATSAKIIADKKISVE